jgi:hypothetical protein
MKPTIVHIKKTKHATQPFTVTIHPPGKKEPYKMTERYSRLDAAKRGAIRHLGGYRHRYSNGGKYRTVGYKLQNGAPIEFK